MVINEKNNNKNKKQEIENSIELFKKIEMLLKINIIIAQKIKIISIILELEERIIADINFVEIIIFNLFKGFLEFINQKSKNFQKFRELFKTQEYLWKYEENKSTLIKQEIDGKTVIKSENTHMHIEKSDTMIKFHMI